jgi:hypothetical protein
MHVQLQKVVAYAFSHVFWLCCFGARDVDDAQDFFLRFFVRVMMVVVMVVVMMIVGVIV